ncbi:MAG: response regulator transcription factor [Lewinellaceae bacterium]|nr:response regulator transcription factor [Lewinellaceae bacterium]
MKTRVVVFDDNPQRRDGLEMLINSMDTMECVACFADCRNAVHHIEQTRPEVVLMDIEMPYIDGVEGTRMIREKFPKLKILMQTVFEDEDKVFAAICAGADGYILKQANPSKLLDAIEEVLTGGAPMTPVIARKVLRLFNKLHTAPQKKTFDLTPRELEILELLVKGYSYKMIAKECHISYATVNTHISHIYGKLQVDSVGGAVYKAIKEGLVK